MFIALILSCYWNLAQEDIVMQFSLSFVLQVLPMEPFWMPSPRHFKIRKPSTGQVPGSRAENDRSTTQHAKNLDRQASLMMPYKWLRKWRTRDMQKIQRCKWNQMEMRRGRQWQEIWKHLENWKHKLKPACGTWDRRRMELVSKCVITTASLRLGEDMKSFQFLLVESADSSKSNNFSCFGMVYKTLNINDVLGWIT